MIRLPDQSVWVVGGTIGTKTSTGGSRLYIHSNAVDRVWSDAGQLRVQAMPEVPGPPRWGMRVVALADGRVLALGGTAWDFIGCGGCLAESYLFDPAERAWQRGPDLLSARANASATRLPDGRVLVAGGWTQDADWGDGGGPAATTEFFLPNTNQFVAGPNMPGGNAGQHALWLPWAQGKWLLTSGGASPLLNLYEVERNRWRTVASPCRPLADDSIIPYLAKADGVLTPSVVSGNGRLQLAIESLALSANEAGFRCFSDESTTSDSPGVATRALYRTAAFSTAESGNTDRPALVAVGGRTPQSQQNFMPTGAVDAIDHAGRTYALPALSAPRNGAFVFALGRSLLVVGGEINRGTFRDPIRLPLEWLSDWRDPDSAWTASMDQFDADAGYALDLSHPEQPALIAIAVSGSVTRVALPKPGTALDANLKLLSSPPVPDLARARRQAQGQMAGRRSDCGRWRANAVRSSCCGGDRSLGRVDLVALPGFWCFSAGRQLRDP
jgi:hypothetical protein